MLAGTIALFAAPESLVHAQDLVPEGACSISYSAVWRDQYAVQYDIQVKPVVQVWQNSVRVNVHAEIDGTPAPGSKVGGAFLNAYMLTVNNAEYPTQWVQAMTVRWSDGSSETIRNTGASFQRPANALLSGISIVYGAGEHEMEEIFELAWPGCGSAAGSEIDERFVSPQEPDPISTDDSDAQTSEGDDIWQTLISIPAIVALMWASLLIDGNPFSQLSEEEMGLFSNDGDDDELTMAEQLLGEREAQIASFTADLVGPTGFAKGAYEGTAARDPITGEPVRGVWRVLSAAGSAFPPAKVVIRGLGRVRSGFNAAADRLRKIGFGHHSTEAVARRVDNATSGNRARGASPARDTSDPNYLPDDSAPGSRGPNEPPDDGLPPPVDGPQPPDPEDAYGALDGTTKANVDAARELVPGVTRRMEYEDEIRHQFREGPRTVTFARTSEGMDDVPVGHVTGPESRGYNRGVSQGPYDSVERITTERVYARRDQLEQFGYVEAHDLDTIQSRWGHAERKAYEEAPGPIGVSLPVCTHCQQYFNALAQLEGSDIVIADPVETFIFRSTGSIERIPNP